MDHHEIPLQTRIFLKRQEIDAKLNNIRKNKWTERKSGSSGGGNERSMLFNHRLRLRAFCEKEGHVFRSVEKPELDYSPIDFKYTAQEGSVCIECRDVRIPPVKRCAVCSSTKIYNTEMIAPKVFGYSTIKVCDCCGYKERGEFNESPGRLMPKSRG